MGGKWLEILTKGNVQAGVHRVVSTSHKSRTSAPFFLRPRNYIAVEMQQQLGAKSGNVFDINDGTQSAVDSLYKFLWQQYF
jgi:isopenicillin N synthase-like dioxygenase